MDHRQRGYYIREKLNIIEELCDMITQNLKPPAKRLRTEHLEIMLTQLMNVNQQKRKEVQLNRMSQKEKEKFQAAITKEIKTNLNKMPMSSSRGTIQNL